MKNRILVVDDEEKMRKLLDMTLGGDFEIMAAASAKEAVVLVTSKSPDLVLTDIKMPGEDGLQLLKRIKEIDSDIPVILMTGHGDKALAIEAIQGGAFDFIEKPFSEEILSISVQRALKVRELSEKQKSATSLLRRKNILLEELSRDLNGAQELAGGVVHEVMTPLSVIQGQALMISKLIDKNPEKIDDMRNCSDSILSMVDRIVKITTSMSSLNERGGGPLLPEKVSSIVEDSVSICREVFEEAGVELQLDIKAKSKIECRSVQISQVLINLLRNACHAVEKLDEKWVELKVTDSKDQIFFSVTDSGSGIEPELHEKLFEAFFTTKRNEGGTGLGLSICRKIAEEHGGQIEIDRDCKNTRFAIRLPKIQPVRE